MLLVDHDQAEVLERREHGRARADADARLAARAAAATRRSARRGVSRECRTATVSPKRSAKRADGLRRQRDLGHEHDRRAAALERGAHGAQVDLRLAAAGHAVQQQALARAPRRRWRAAPPPGPP